MLKFQLNICFSELLSYHYQFNSSMKYTGETSFCDSGKTSNMLDNGVTRKNSLRYVKAESQN